MKPKLSLVEKRKWYVRVVLWGNNNWTWGLVLDEDHAIYMQKRINKSVSLGLCRPRTWWIRRHSETAKAPSLSKTFNSSFATSSAAVEVSFPATPVADSHIDAQKVHIHRKSWGLTHRPSGSLYILQFRQRLQSGASTLCGCSRTSVAPRTQPVSPPARYGERQKRKEEIKGGVCFSLFTEP